MTEAYSAGVSVVLCARNEAELIGNQLSALSRQRPGVPWELIVVDNGSIDATVEVVETFDQELPVRVVAHAPPGVAGARNAGVRVGQYELIAHCDADDVVTDGWLEALVLGLTDHAVVTGPVDEVALNHDVNLVRPLMPHDRLEVSNGFLPYAIGANLAYRREVHDAVGGWAEDFRSSGDDVDFTWSAQLAGFEIGFVPEATVRYRHRLTARELFRQYVAYGEADPLLFRRHRANGMERDVPTAIARRWLHLAAGLPLAVIDTSRRARWLTTLGWSVGRLTGSVRHRSVYL